MSAVLVCAAWGIGATAGQLLGGWAGGIVLRASGDSRCRICYLMAASTCLSVLPLLAVLNLRFGRHLVVIAVMGGLLSGVTGPNIRAVLLNCNAPDTRGRLRL